ncbi:MAG: 23S rRNA (uracil(1939)-C(5))-methyltransferase RlmD [Deltaproteobacteria bacterium HGW-Deltaproteobacteria-4]|nr:MAG: 23S rRNA (uracil(1939)-C(5))-methyltransferase RlmD [Deltaproteobacteria bacterium HGW-Deltaproteobacteria-4]
MLELTIENLVFGGNGLGRLDGKAIFVPLTAPGDQILCRIVRDKGRWAEAELVEILQPAAERITPPCPVFGLCGGCQWQFLPYSEQARWKEAIYRDLLQRQAGVAAEKIRPIVVAPEPYAYRSRAQFKCCHGSQDFTLGFFRKGSHNVEGINACPLLPAAVNQLIPLLKSAIDGTAVATHIPQIDAGIDDRGKVRLVIHARNNAGAEVAELLRPLALQEDFALFVQSDRREEGLRHVCGEEDLVINCDTPPLALAYKAGGFSQINLEQNRTLLNAVLSAAELQGKERVIDLYCGMGNFSLPLALRCAEVVGVEDYAPSIIQAKINARQNSLKNTQFYARPAFGALRAYGQAAPFDLVVLDPPREGASDVCRELIDLGPPRILYISCDPATQARDLKTLLNNGYRCLSAQPFDFFPQTHHIESLVVLVRN